jgi:hypothetical protein
MSILNNSWSSESIDVINIRAGNCKLEVKGTDDDLVRIEGDFDEKHWQDIQLDSSGRRLKVFIPHNRSAEFTLILPRNKPWVTQIFAGKADIQVKDVYSRIQLMTGKGDIQIEDQKGTLSIVSGHGDLRVKHFVQVEIPDPPALPPDPPSTSQSGPAWDWLHWDGKEWENWGEGLGEKIGWWAMDFSRLFERSLVTEKNPGINLLSSNGNVELSDIEANNGLLRVSRGNLEMKQAQFTNLEVNLGHGDFEGWSIVPSGDWSIRNSNGNIHLSLPSNIPARLDIGTRNGDIHSDIPLVRVTRQGPESASGKRMVGSIGPKTGGNPPEIRIVANHGDVEVDSHSPSQPNASEKAREDVSTSAVDIAERPAHCALPEDSPLVILESLRQGKITVAEAEQLLKGMSL